MSRRTRRDAEAALALLVKRLPKHVATSYNDIGGWALDWAPGGAMVTEIVNGSGGVTCPLGYARRSPAEFCTAISFALACLDVAQVRA